MLLTNQCSIATLLLLFVFTSISAAADKPNVILIFADDLGYGDLGCFNKNCPFETPRLDQMAREGAKLTSFYVPTPYCAPSRGTILTGRYPFRHSVVRNPAPDAGESNYGLPSSEITIAEILKAHGYATAMYGKWHLGHKPQWLPRTQGFDDYFGILYSNDMYPVQLVANEEVAEYPVVQAHLTDRYTQRTIDFIDQHKDQPFFIYLAHAMPHKPLAASDHFYTPETKDNLYADVIAELDTAVGRVLDKLKQTGLDENTLVIFTSDNGPWFGGSTGGLRGMKARTWEGGLRVPMIARFPGLIPAGIQSDQPTGTIDILPTICQITGADVPDDRIIDGADLTNLLCGFTREGPHEAIFAMTGPNLATIRSGDWKLHVARPGPRMFGHLSPEEQANWIDPRAPDGVTIIAPFEQAKPNQHPGLTTGDERAPMMLFNLKADPGEQHNVATQHPQVVARLKNLFDEMNAQVPEFPTPPSDYLFRDPPQGSRRPLMRLIGGELRYDKIPKSQRHLLKQDDALEE